MKGFTLMEVLIAIGILATVVILIAQVFITTTRSNTTTGIRTSIERDGNFSLDVLERLIRGASQITAQCDAGTATTSAIIKSADANTTTITCVSDGVSARIASVSAQGVTYYLSGVGSTLSTSGSSVCSDSSLRFSCPSATGVEAPITISFTLRTIGSGPSTELEFTGVATARH